MEWHGENIHIPGPGPPGERTPGLLEVRQSGRRSNIIVMKLLTVWHGCRLNGVGWHDSSGSSGRYEGWASFHSSCKGCCSLLALLSPAGDRQLKISVSKRYEDLRRTSAGLQNNRINKDLKGLSRRPSD